MSVYFPTLKPEEFANTLRRSDYDYASSRAATHGQPSPASELGSPMAYDDQDFHLKLMKGIEHEMEPVRPPPGSSRTEFDARVAAVKQLVRNALDTSQHRANALPSQPAAPGAQPRMHSHADLRSGVGSSFTEGPRPEADFLPAKSRPRHASGQTVPCRPVGTASSM